MSINFSIVSHDGIYQRLSTDKILLNNRDIFDTEERAILNKLIIQTYSDDNISLIPSCHCGELKNEYYVGNVCKKCGTRVVSSVDSNLSFLLWLKQPEGVAKFISPIVMSFLLARYKISKPSIKLIKYILTPNMKIDKSQSLKSKETLSRLNFLMANNNIPRGYNGFVNNFFKMVEILEYEFKANKLHQKEEFMKFLRDNEANIFSSYLPFPNKVLFTMDCNELGKYIDKSILNPVNVIRRVSGIDLYPKTVQVKELKVANSLIDLADFYNGYFKKNVFSKPGLIRQHGSGTRCHFTGRAVITSIPGPHSYKEVWLPWSLSCTLFKFHLLNRLYARGMSNKEANALLMRYNRIYSPVLDECFAEILEQNGGSYPVIINRNPSLHRGSIQSELITRIKKDAQDNTISMSTMIAKNFNADFDGDNINITIPMTNKVKRNMHNFEPHHSVVSLTSPGEFSGNLGFPKTIVSNLASWYND